MTTLRSFAVLAALSFSALSVAAAQPAVPAGTDNGVCESGEFCLYSERGDLVDRTQYDSDLWKDTVIKNQDADQWWNRTGKDWFIYDGKSCTGHSFRLETRYGDAHVLAPEWRGKLRSMARQDQTWTCKQH